MRQEIFVGLVLATCAGACRSPPSQPRVFLAPETPAEREQSSKLDKAQIRATIQRHRDEIRGCYDRVIAARPSIQGKVAVRFVIAADGKVREATVAETTTTNDPELEACVTESLKTWTFSPPTGGGVVIVTYPFLFTSSRGQAIPPRNE